MNLHINVQSALFLTAPNCKERYPSTDSWANIVIYNRILLRNKKGWMTNTTGLIIKKWTKARHKINMCSTILLILNLWAGKTSF